MSEAGLSLLNKGTICIDLAHKCRLPANRIFRGFILEVLVDFREIHFCQKHVEITSSQKQSQILTDIYIYIFLHKLALKSYRVCV